MPPFRYLRDPIFLAALCLYPLNRWLLKPIEGTGGFFHSFGNDLLCIPLFLPLSLWLYRRAGIRGHDGMPTRFEILAHLAVWSFYFEWAAPRMGGMHSWTVGDWRDVFAYAAGTAIASAFWRAKSRFRPVACRRTQPEVSG